MPCVTWLIRSCKLKPPPSPPAFPPPPIIDPWNANISARSTSRGPGGYEYFWGDNGFEGEMAQGSLALFPGSDVFLTTQVDAIGHRSQHGLAAINFES